MNIFQKKLSTKKLSLREMWELYKTIEDGFPKQDEVYLLDEFIKLIQGISTHNFKKALGIMYGEDFHSKVSSAQFALLFVQGVKKNNLFPFVGFIKSLSK